MFVALRELRAAKGRFGLMAGVVALITILLILLTALTAGLGHQSTSAIDELPAGQIVLAKTNGTASFADSDLTDAQVAAWSDTGATTLGIGHGRVTHNSAAASVALFSDGPADGVALGRDTADALGVGVGDVVTLGTVSLPVREISPTRWYSHSPVVGVPAARYADITHQQPRTALLLATPVSDAASRDAAAGTASLSRSQALMALPGYRSEHGSLLLIQVFLYAICALVVVAFVSVWAIQRTRELAVIRALGGSRGYVLRDALGQAAVLLLAGLAIGGVIAAAGLATVPAAVPVLATALTYVVPLAGVFALGLAGSFIATRRVSRVDPLLALGGN